MNEGVELRRYLVGIRKKVPFTLGGHSQPHAKESGLANRVKAGFSSHLAL